MHVRIAALATLVAASAALFATPVSDAVPARTSVTYLTLTGAHFGTPNEHDARAGLSIVKLYVVDYALRRGDGAPSDRALAERMIRLSDDAAADELDRKYPDAIDAVASEFGLTSTTGRGYWGNAFTSTADTAAFLAAKLKTDPRSPIFGWMATAARVAADGTETGWGTANVPGVIGTKWGWSDAGPSEVASASFGAGFVVAAQTLGTPNDQNVDLLSAIPGLMSPQQ